ncbi:MAG TPA: SbcC/MukB-like Walker B domain-containing protein, partial [Candidatus Caenarcaniphilales bacterium]
EFQVNTASGFRSLTERGMRATQQTILNHLRLDYDTFVNSAYLRQGRADEFMLKRPSDRKQLLSELLKLDQYDALAEKAKDCARQFKGQVLLLEQNLAAIETQLEQAQAIAAAQASLETDLAQLQALQEADTDQLQRLQATQQQRQTWQQQLKWQQHIQQNLVQELQHLQHQLTAAQQQQQELELLLQQSSQIEAEFNHFQRLQVEEETQATKFRAYQTAQEQKLELQQQQNRQQDALQTQLRQAEAQRDDLQQQEQEIQQTLSKARDVEAALVQLQQARMQRSQLDQLQTQVFPLLQRQQQLQAQLEHQTYRLSARLEELHSNARQLQTQATRQPQIQQAVVRVTQQINDLEKKRTYQQHIQEKGMERRNFMERLQAHQRDYETQLAHLDQKIELLSQPNALCPLCDRSLDPTHWALVQQKHDTQKQEILNQIWVVREQLAVSEREIQVLRREYRSVEQQLAQYKTILEQRGQLQEQLHTSDHLSHTLQQIKTEVDAVEQSLKSGDYAVAVQTELQQLQQTLSQLNYDEKDHALARGQVERWRWAESKGAEIKQAQRRQAQIAARLPALHAQIATLTEQLQQQRHHPIQQQLEVLDRHLAEIDYNLEHHNDLRATLRQAQVWQLRHQGLRQAAQQYPKLQQQSRELTELRQARSQDLEAVTTQMEVLTQQLRQTLDDQAPLQRLAHQIQQRRGQLDQKIGQLGRLQQQQQQFETLKIQHQAQQQQLKTLRRQTQIYQELAQAFGRNGLQALMIENVLPQLEAETNQILARLSANQLHVQFVTQRAGRGSKQNSKLIDTLDILIADVRGTRAYETYSGGEAFRVSFAIRLALARLLAQRTGSDLQMLIVDEGFGTQDAEGCERLVAAINAIAPDFACILTVTHIPSLKEAFQARIDVIKTTAGSELSLSV